MFLFLDTEFTDLSKQGELISIALAESEHTWFYAELTDRWPERLKELEVTAPDQVDWLRENVLSKLILDGQDTPVIIAETKYRVRGSREQVRDALRSFLAQYDAVELVCDVGHFDMIHFIDLFGDAMHDMPANVTPAYWDLCQFLAIPERSIARGFQESGGGPHNALQDALFTMRRFREIWECMVSEGWGRRER